MMWHWNSLWAPAQGDPPAVDDPALWRGPWTAEQTIALQARAWDAMAATGRAWWNLWILSWPVPGTAGTAETPSPASGSANPGVQASNSTEAGTVKAPHQRKGPTSARARSQAARADNHQKQGSSRDE